MPATIDHPPRGRPGGTTLPDLDTGVTARVVALDVAPSELRRLLSMGIRVGSDIEVTHHRGGSVVVAAAGGRVALGAGAGRNVVVERGGR